MYLLDEAPESLPVPSSICFFRKTGPVAEIPDAVQSPNSNKQTKKDHPKPVLARCLTSSTGTAGSRGTHAGRGIIYTLPPSLTVTDIRRELTPLCQHSEWVLPTGWWAPHLPTFAQATLPPHRPVQPPRFNTNGTSNRKLSLFSADYVSRTMLSAS